VLILTTCLAVILVTFGSTVGSRADLNIHESGEQLQAGSIVGLTHVVISIRASQLVQT
jgi:hypothetical protein